MMGLRIFRSSNTLHDRLNQEHFHLFRRVDVDTTLMDASKHQLFGVFDTRLILEFKASKNILKYKYNLFLKSDFDSQEDAAFKQRLI